MSKYNEDTKAARRHEVDAGVVTKALGGLDEWYHRCHEASLELVRSGVLPEGARVARGSHTSVLGQHSWVVIGDPYAADVTIIDPTLWSYLEEQLAFVEISSGSDTRYRPHGAGSIWEYGRPPEPAGPVITLATKLSPAAQLFLDMIGYGLDRRSWSILANAPVGGWPAKEILGAMYDDERLSALVPIDVIGMVTDRNPGNLYW